MARPPDGGNGLDARKHHPPRSTMRRTGRLDTPSMPVSSSAFPASPPQPSWRIRAMMSRIGWAPLRGVRLADHLHLAAAVALDAQEPGRERANGSSRASAPEGNGRCRRSASGASGPAGSRVRWRDPDIPVFSCAPSPTPRELSPASREQVRASLRRAHAPPWRVGRVNHPRLWP